MPRRARTEGDALPDEKALIPAYPSHAGSLEDLIDERFKHLLSLSTDSKDLTKALEAASAWVKIRRDVKEPEWGGQLGRTMR